MRTTIFTTVGALVGVTAIIGILRVLDVVSTADALSYGGKISGIVVILAVAIGIIKGISSWSSPPAV